MDTDTAIALREQARALRDEADEKYRMSRSKAQADLYWSMVGRSLKLHHEADALFDAARQGVR